MALLGFAGGVCGVLAAVAVSAPSRGRLETSVNAEDVVDYTATGRQVVRAELLWTADSTDVPWPKRTWRAEPIKGVDLATGRLSVRRPTDARECVVNLISEDGLIASTPVL